MKKLTLISLSAVIFLLVACSLFSIDEPPGVGEKAELGYSTCAPIIAALEKFHAQNKQYPDSLQELIPDYIAEIPLEVNEQPIAYSKTEESFSLSFYYIGPGMNACTYTPENDWHCSGSY